MAGGILYNIPMSEENNFKPDLKSISKSVLKMAKILFLSYPHNPTTACVDLGFYEEIAKWVKDKNLIIASDLAYSDIVFDGYKTPSVLQVKGIKDKVIEFQTNAILGVPMRNVDQEPVGVLEAINKPDGSAFSEQDVETLSILADLAGVAVEKARLFAELQQANSELSELDKLKELFSDKFKDYSGENKSDIKQMWIDAYNKNELTIEFVKQMIEKVWRGYFTI